MLGVNWTKHLDGVAPDLRFVVLDVAGLEEHDLGARIPRRRDAPRAFRPALERRAREVGQLLLAMDAERFSRLADAAVAAAENLRDEPLFELADGILEVDALVDHLLDKPFEPLRNHGSSSRPVSRRKASRYFSRVFTITIV